MPNTPIKAGSRIFVTADLDFGEGGGWELLETPLPGYDETYHVTDSGASFTFTDAHGSPITITDLQECTNLEVKNLDAIGKFRCRLRTN